jgi:hypothetical protein
MKFRSILITLALLVSAPAFSQQLLNCITATSTPCNTSGQIGNGTQGDPAWLAFGKINADVTYLYANLPVYPISVALGGTGGTSSTGTGALVLASSPTLVTPLTTGFLIASLPACNSGLEGAFTYVTNGVTSPSYLGTVSTTGSTVAPVFCNGTAWVYH